MHFVVKTSHTFLKTLQSFITDCEGNIQATYDQTGIYILGSSSNKTIQQPQENKSNEQHTEINNNMYYSIKLDLSYFEEYKHNLKQEESAFIFWNWLKVLEVCKKYNSIHYEYIKFDEDGAYLIPYGMINVYKFLYQCIFLFFI